MALIIPYTFTAGTKAKAGEVNDNFTAVKAFVDLLETNQASDEVDIATLQTGKADINGSFTERFQVADAVNTMDAVNKKTLLSNISNSLGYIDGFILSVLSDTSISATAGTCYDSTKTVVLSSTTALTAEQTNLASSGTYYLYVAGDGGSGIQLLISLSSVTPTLPSGYSYFRLVGSFTTDANAYIKTVNSYSNSQLVDDALWQKVFPNYSASWINYPQNTNNTMPNYGWIKWYGVGNDGQNVSIIINGKTVGSHDHYKYGDQYSILYPVSKGDVVYAQYPSSISFIPCKGV